MNALEIIGAISLVLYVVLAILYWNGYLVFETEDAPPSKVDSSR